MFFKENILLDDVKTNKIWQILSAFVISKSVNEIKGKIKILIGQAKKNNKRANKKEKNKNNKKTENNIENNINKLILLINNYEEIEQKLNKKIEEINWKELEKMATLWNIFNKIKDSKDLEDMDDLTNENLDSSVNLDYIRNLHIKEILKLLPEEWIEINQKEKIQQQSVLYRYLNATKQTEEIMKAKNKMRKLLGEEGMFKSLEMKQPILFRLDLIEYEYKLLLYKTLFNNSYTSSISKKAITRLDISFVFKKVIETINSKKDNNLMKNFRKDWNKSLINKQSVEIICNMANLFYKIIGSKETIDLNLLINGEQKIGFLNEIHEKEIINLYKNKDGIFKKFIKQTWGARYRLLVHLRKNIEIVQIMIEEGYNSNLKEILKIELKEKELIDLIEYSYLNMFKEENNLKIDNQINFDEYIADLLILINFFGKKFEKSEILNEWENIKQINLYIIDSLINIKTLKNMNKNILEYHEPRVILCKNMLFSLKDFSMEENKLKNYLKNELEILKQKIFDPPELKNENEIIKMQNKLHSKMILKLMEERKDFKAEMDGLKGIAKSKFEYLIGKTKEEKNKKLQENNEKIEYNKITYNCPENSKIVNNEENGGQFLLKQNNNCNRKELQK
uniref:Uncharacterized protein n=1 Tax=Meloidogyne hapla TaxID=6305 RepID=A0A1I8BFF8_MELHA